MDYLKEEEKSIKKQRNNWNWLEGLT
jgi:hypothetical protein